MKILMLNNYYYLRGGSEKVLLGEMELLQDNGHEVAISSDIGVDINDFKGCPVINWI